MIQKRNFNLDLHYEIPAESCQPFFLFTTYFNLTEKQMARTIEQLVSELEMHLGVKITMLQITDFDTGSEVDLNLYREFPKAITSSEQLKKLMNKLSN